MNIVIKASIYLWSLLTQSIHKGIDANIFISNNLLQDLATFSMPVSSEEMNLSLIKAFIRFIVIPKKSYPSPIFLLKYAWKLHIK